MDAKLASFNVGDVDKLPQEAGEFSEGSFTILASPALEDDFFSPSGISRSGLFLAALEIQEVSADMGETCAVLDSQPSAVGSPVVSKASG